MKNKNLKTRNIRKITIGLFSLLFLTGTASAAHYRVTIDCNHSSISNTDTTNRITASFLDRNRSVIRRVSKTGITNCARNEAGFSINSERTLGYVEFSTNGNDAYYIDEWRLFVDGRLVKRTGTDNARGWCLSTDPGDARGPWQRYVTGGCRSRIRFPVSVSTVPTGNRAYRLTVDCSHSSITNTDTTNRITAAFLDENRRVIRRVAKNGIRNCQS
ncbi:MAG: hypothetical protein HKN25_16825, partial [Pyrinomonadaceae bacterium]|nr:hypothetical protein [Pyrinomonadaceae bacterium]